MRASAISLPLHSTARAMPLKNRHTDPADLVKINRFPKEIQRWPLSSLSRE